MINVEAGDYAWLRAFALSAARLLVMDCSDIFYIKM